MTPLLESTLAMLVERYPGQATLTLEQVAKALQYEGPGPRQWVRRNIERGTILPNLRKVNGHYIVPLPVFAAWLVGLQGEPPAEVIRPPAGPDYYYVRRRKKVPANHWPPPDPVTGKPRSLDDMWKEADFLLRHGYHMRDAPSQGKRRGRPKVEK